MAERSSELDQDTSDSTTRITRTDDTDNSEIATSSAFATTSVGDYTGDEDNDVRTLSTTDPGAVVDASAEPAEIQAQIEQTRSEMSETINAIQEKLSISNIADQVKEEVSDTISGAYESAKTAIFDATAGKVGDFMTRINRGINQFTEDYGPAISEAGTTVVRAAKTNPLPFALIGAGVTMLLLNNRRKSSRVRSYRYRDTADFDNESSSTGSFGRRGSRRNYASTGGNQDSTLSSAYNRVGDVAGQAYQGATSAASSAVHGASSAASSAVQGVSSAANTAYQGVSSVAGSAYGGVTSGVSSIGSGAKQAARWTQDTYERQLEENPFAVGAVAFAIGAVLGLAVPSTQLEGQYLGEYRENLIQQAQDAAGGLIDKAQHVASEVTQTVKEEVNKAQGSTA